MNPERLAAIRDQVARDVQQLTDQQARALLVPLFTLAAIRRRTLSERYWTQSRAVLRDLAPSFADELERTIRLVDDFAEIAHQAEQWMGQIRSPREVS